MLNNKTRGTLIIDISVLLFAYLIEFKAVNQLKLSVLQGNFKLVSFWTPSVVVNIEQVTIIGVILGIVLEFNTIVITSLITLTP